MIKNNLSINHIGKYQTGELPESAVNMETPKTMEEPMKKTVTMGSVLCAPLLILLLLVGCGANGDSSKQTTKSEYMVLVGEDSTITDKVSNVDLLIIDASYFSKEEIAELKSNNVSKIYSYLNIGSVENFRSYYDDYRKYAMGAYENWPEEQWMDVSQPEWQEFIIRESNELASKGIDGFFVDNVDVYDYCTKEDIYDGLIKILSEIKELNLPVLINGGDSFVRKYIETKDTLPIFDGVNQECVYTTYDFNTGSCLENTEEEKKYFTEYLDMLVEKGYKAYVIEYMADANVAKKVYTYAQEHNYICYVSDNIELKSGTCPTASK